jgi:hypothetical protein
MTATKSDASAAAGVDAAFGDAGAAGFGRARGGLGLGTASDPLVAGSGEFGSAIEGSSVVLVRRARTPRSRGRTSSLPRVTFGCERRSVTDAQEPNVLYPAPGTCDRSGAARRIEEGILW